MPGKDGLLHISKLRDLNDGKRVENVDDVVKVGQKVMVAIAEIDDRGKLSLAPVVEETAVTETVADEAEADTAK
jgi:polyribonucleotide nucleotidyltransferase